ncbi:MAG TPA: tripartite tricarboxylate transporter substrate binding protein [Burkholderiales bacterium]|nr:tripartite tricarboxylate transporter substrate binding protein [Burkholderiales bacterium]
MSSGRPGRWRPEREIEIVAGTPPGGGLDRAARALLGALESNRLLEVAARVVNVPGDGARKCWAHLDARAGDPHVLAISSANLTTDRLLGATRFHHERDFTPLAILYTEYIAFVVRRDCPLQDGACLIARLAKDAASLTVALSTSAGNPNHIALAKVVRHAGAEPRALRIRVFDSALDAVADTLAGGADLAAVTAASAVEELEAGTMRALAVSAPERLAGPYAGTPTWREQSVDCVIGSWRGVTAARGLAQEHVAYWEETLAAAVNSGQWRAQLARLHWTPWYLDGARLREYLRREAAEASAVLKDLALL